MISSQEAFLLMEFIQVIGMLLKGKFIGLKKIHVAGIKYFINEKSADSTFIGRLAGINLV